MSRHERSCEGKTRRAFLAGAGGLAAAGVVGGSIALATPRRSWAAGGNRIVTTVPNLYRGQNANYFREIQFNENTHVNTIVGLLGAAARPKPTFQNIQARNLHEFVEMSALFENTGAGAYNGSAPAIFSPTILSQASSIALVEAYQAGYLNTILDRPIVPVESPVADALSALEVNDRLGYFIASFNGGPPPGYSEVPSPANDIDILNFALVAEYLERDFYNLNVPIFFH